MGSKVALTPGGIARTVGLWILILGAIASSAVDFTKNNSQWGWAKVMVAVLVIAHEIFRYVNHGETISTKYKKFIEHSPFWGYVSLALFALSLLGLILHLAVW